MKLSLRQKQGIVRWLLGLMLGLLIMEVAFGDRGLFSGSWILKGPIIALFATAVFLLFKWWRCPKCRKLLGRNTGSYCPHCGEKIDYDAK